MQVTYRQTGWTEVELATKNGDNYCNYHANEQSSTNAMGFVFVYLFIFLFTLTT